MNPDDEIRRMNMNDGVRRMNLDDGLRSPIFQFLRVKVQILLHSTNVGPANHVIHFVDCEFLTQHRQHLAMLGRTDEIVFLEVWLVDADG